MSLLIALVVMCVVYIRGHRLTHRTIKGFVEYRDQSELQLKEAKLAAEESERTKAQFLAAMSREIRTPLNAVIGLSDLVLKTDLDSLQRDYLTKVSSAGKNLLAMINDILDFSKSEPDKLEVENIVFELNPVLSNATTVVNARAEDNGNELVIHSETLLPKFLVGEPLRQSPHF